MSFSGASTPFEAQSNVKAAAAQKMPETAQFCCLTLMHQD
jgi:hypothetical protein